MVTAPAMWDTATALELDQEELEGVPKPGDVVVEKYRVDRVLGVGGMGCVVAATHTSLGTPVAIKFLLARAARNPNNIERFQREAQAAARIKSDHVAKVTDVGTLGNGTPYMIMEFLEGEDLSERLKRGGVAIPEACRYILQACEALAEAHQAGIVHRDLKPANLFLSPHPSGGHRIKVLDFGISKILAEPGVAPGADLTKTSTLMGSPLYMSPEQMMSAKDADARADIWALGVILHELITGIPPFIGGTLPEICSKILTAPPTPLSQALPGAPPNLAAVIARALEKKPDARYPTLAELAVALAPFAGPDGRRSAEVVCRVLGRSPSVASAVPSTTPGHPARIDTSPRTAPVQGQHHVPTDPGGYGAPAVVQTGGTQVSTHGETVVSPHQMPAMAEGAQTAAPVAQTFDGAEPKRSRRALVAAAVVGLVVLLAAAVGLIRKGRRRAAAATPETTAEPAQERVGVADEPSGSEANVADSEGDDNDDAGEGSDDTGDATGASTGPSSGGQTPGTSAGANKPPPALTTPKRPRKPRKPRLPRPLRPNKHKVKQGDDFFN